MTQKRHAKSALVTRWLSASVVPLLLTGFGAPAMVHAEELPTLNDSETKIYYENDTRMRGKDATGNRVGLSKFRNTLKVEHKRELGDGWSFKGIFRGTYDGVYDLNDEEYGKNAGGPINVTELSGFNFNLGVPGSTPTTVPYGSSAINLPPNIDQIAFLTSGGFITGNFTGQQAFDPVSNPNQGLQHLGQRWNSAYSGTGFGKGHPPSFHAAW